MSNKLCNCHGWYLDACPNMEEVVTGTWGGPVAPPGPPETIETGHLIWKLSVVPATELPTEAAVYGCTDCARLTIFMQQGMPKPLQVDVLLHECLHAIYFAYGIRKKIREEEACLVLAGPLVALMRDNPQLVQWAQSL